MTIVLAAASNNEAQIMNQAPNCSLSVSRKDLLETLRLIKKTKGIGLQPVIVTFDGRQLCFDFGAGRFRTPAIGTWQGQVTFRSELLKRFAQASPKYGDTVPVTYDGESLRIGDWFVRCEWSHLAAPRITLPLGVSQMEILFLRKLHTLDDIERSGLEPTLAEAEGRVQELVEKAAAILAPLQIDKAEVMRLVDERVSELARKWHSRAEEHG